MELTETEREIVLAYRRKHAAREANEAENEQVDLNDIQPGMSREKREAVLARLRTIAAQRDM